jgi:hypothetical protein
MSVEEKKRPKSGVPLSYYALGQLEGPVAPSRVPEHMAEPVWKM